MYYYFTIAACNLAILYFITCSFAPPVRLVIIWSSFTCTCTENSALEQIILIFLLPKTIYRCCCYQFQTSSNGDMVSIKKILPTMMIESFFFKRAIEISLGKSDIPALVVQIIIVIQSWPVYMEGKKPTVTNIFTVVQENSL